MSGLIEGTEEQFVEADLCQRDFGFPTCDMLSVFTGKITWLPLA